MVPAGMVASERWVREVKDSRLVVARDSESPTTHIDGGISGSCPGDDKFHPGSAISLESGRV